MTVASSATDAEHGESMGVHSPLPDEVIPLVSTGTATENDNHVKLFNTAISTNALNIFM